MIKEALLLNGGLGTRTYPLGKYLPKCLIPVYDTPLLFYQLQMFEELGVEKIHLVVNRYFEVMVRESLEKSYAGKMNIQFIIQEANTGCGEATYLGKGLISDKFFLVLGDEYYETDYFFREALQADAYDHYLGVTEYDSLAEIRSGCHIVYQEGQIQHLFEKPKLDQITNGMCWNGAAVTTPLIFEELDQLKREGQVDPQRGVILIDGFNRLLNKGIKLGAVYDPMININVTCVDDYVRASKVEQRKRLRLAQGGGY